jgi:hypothetical protein
MHGCSFGNGCAQSPNEIVENSSASALVAVFWRSDYSLLHLFHDTTTSSEILLTRVFA